MIDYTDENKVIAKNTSLIVRRVPRSVSAAARGGHGASNTEPRRTNFHQIPQAQQKTFALYNNTSSNTTSRLPEGLTSSEEAASGRSLSSVLLGNNQEEEIRLQAMVKESAAEWNKQLDLQETFSYAIYVLNRQFSII